MREPEVLRDPEDGRVVVLGGPVFDSRLPGLIARSPEGAWLRFDDDRFSNWWGGAVDMDENLEPVPSTEAKDLLNEARAALVPGES